MPRCSDPARAKQELERYTGYDDASSSRVPLALFRALCVDADALVETHQTLVALVARMEDDILRPHVSDDAVNLVNRYIDQLEAITEPDAREARRRRLQQRRAALL